MAGPRNRPRERLADIVFAKEQIEIMLEDAGHLLRAVGLIAVLDEPDAQAMSTVAAQAELLIDSAAAGMRELSRALHRA
jgi:hypothetical protein